MKTHWLKEKHNDHNDHNDRDVVVVVEVRDDNKVKWGITRYFAKSFFFFKFFIIFREKFFFFKFFIIFRESFFFFYYTLRKVFYFAKKFFFYFYYISRKVFFFFLFAKSFFLLSYIFLLFRSWSSHRIQPSPNLPWYLVNTLTFRKLDIYLLVESFQNFSIPYFFHSDIFFFFFFFFSFKFLRIFWINIKYSLLASFNFYCIASYKDDKT